MWPSESLGGQLWVAMLLFEGSQTHTATVHSSLRAGFSQGRSSPVPDLMATFPLSTIPQGGEPVSALWPTECLQPFLWHSRPCPHLGSPAPLLFPLGPQVTWDFLNILFRSLYMPFSVQVPSPCFMLGELLCILQNPRQPSQCRKPPSTTPQQS